MVGSRTEGRTEKTEADGQEGAKEREKDGRVVEVGRL